MDDLHLEISRCSLCRLLTGRRFGSSSHGNPNSKVMLISEAPGKDSIEKQKMWSGVSGLKIRNIFREFREFGCELEDCVYMTDLVKCLPPDNRKPKRDEILNCRGFLRREIEVLNPAVILALGKTALVHLTELFGYPVSKPIKMWDHHARTDIFVGENDINLIPLYHPSWENKFVPDYSADLRRIFKDILADLICCDHERGTAWAANGQRSLEQDEEVGEGKKRWTGDLHPRIRTGMLLLSIETCNEEIVNGYLDDGENYRGFVIRPGKPIKYDGCFPKRDYRDLEHFAGVIGKFDPYAFILKDPIEIESPDFETLYRLGRPLVP